MIDPDTLEAATNFTTELRFDPSVVIDVALSRWTGGGEYELAISVDGTQIGTVADGPGMPENIDRWLEANVYGPASGAATAHEARAAILEVALGVAAL